MDAETRPTAERTGEEFGALLGEVAAALRESPRLRELAGRLSEWLARVLEEVEPEDRSRQAQRGSREETAAVPLEERRLTLGSAQAVVKVPETGEAPPALPRPSAAPVVPPVPVERSLDVAPNLVLLVRRAQHMAECCRWAIQRRRRLARGDEFDTAIKPRDKELGRESQDLETFSWPLDPYASLPTDDELEKLACCYENVAGALELARDIRSDDELGHDYMRVAYQLLAEAQSALRIGLLNFADRKNDDVQHGSFRWLRLITNEDHVYVPRHMQLNDPGDPCRWHELQEEIEALRGDWASRKEKARRRKNLFGKIRYHVQRIEQAADEARPEDWSRIDEAVGDLLADGLPPSNVELRDLLLPVVERIPEGYEVGQGLRRAVAAVDCFLAGREVQGGKGQREREISEEVKRVARWLRGRTVVLIGGEVRPKSKEALERAFELGSLHWISAAPGTSFSTFEPAVARRETAVVLLAIRWSSHGFSQVSELCRRHGKLLVRLPAGYSPNQVARQILEQVGDRLCASDST